MISIENIIEILKKHNVSEEKIKEVETAYLLATEIHKNQFRQSGEPYITHPLNVAKNILNMEVFDSDTISAAILHDSVEDSLGNFTKEDIATIINPTVAMLVDGVSKISRMEFSSKQEQNLANTRKIINGLIKDVRIIIIKLCDRLHNMSTLEYKCPKKQKENAEETLGLFVPLALAIGAYKIKSDLEDLSFRYLLPDEYFKIIERRSLLARYEESCLAEVAGKIQTILNSKSISNDIIIRTKNAYTTYRKTQQGYKLENIYDLFYLKIIVEEIEECYQTLAIVHKNNPPINGRFKDYIYNPRTNLYQSLHTTVTTPNNKKTKIKIRTNDMDKVAAYGISARWNIKNGQTQEESQREIREKLQFAKKLKEIDSSFSDNHQFVEEIKNELLTEHVYVYNSRGEIIELPSGSTGFDYVCHENPDLLDQMTGIIVNDKEVPINYPLQNNDSIKIVTKGLVANSGYDYLPAATSKEKIKVMIGLLPE